jgi:DNA-binding IclR family transcriptional regulator
MGCELVNSEGIRIVKPNNQLSRGLSIIECLSVFGSLTTEELSVETGIPRSSVYRILGILEGRNYVLKSKKGLEDAWGLDLKLLTLSARILSRVDLKTEIRDILVKLAEDTMEIVQLARLQEDKVLIVDNIRKYSSMVGGAQEGTLLSINTCVAGLVFGAFLEPEQLENVLKTAELPRFTQYTITDPDELRREFDRVRRRGYALDDQYNAIGHRCIGAPVFDHTGKIVAEINISGHISTISDDRIEELAAKVKSRAAEASRRMGYSPEIGNYIADTGDVEPLARL